MRREGRLTSGQREALERYWPRFGVELAAGAFDFETLFDNAAKPLTLEIGFGNGDTLAEIAEQEPHHNFIGIEVHRPGVGHLLRLTHEKSLANLRIFNEDAVRVLDVGIPDHRLDRVLILFPDPWPKKRHHKRRLVQTEFVAKLARKIRPGGTLRIATDWADYAEHIAEVMSASTQFSKRETTGLRPVTRFEKRGLRLGHEVCDLIFEKIEKPGNL